MRRFVVRRFVVKICGQTGLVLFRSFVDRSFVNRRNCRFGGQTGRVLLGFSGQGFSGQGLVVRPERVLLA
jgi:hypothetical protein